MSIFDKLKSTAGQAVNAAAQSLGSKRERFTFAALPESLAEMQALPEASLDTPFKTAALTVLALCAYAADKSIGTEMLNWLRGPRPLNGQEISFLNDRFRDGKTYACYSSFLSLLSLFPTTEKKLFCRTYPKEKRCNLKKRLQRFLKSIFNFAGHFHLSSFSTSLISFAVAVTIRIPLSLMVSSNVSSCRRCVFFVSGFSKRNWSTDIS